MSLHRLLDQPAALQLIHDAHRNAAKPTFFLACGFAGGFGLGAKAAGGRVIGGLESAEMPFGARVAQQGWPVIIEPQANWGTAAFVSRLPKADALIMNPPCSAYAQNGLRGGMADPVMCNLHACVELALAMAPKVWAWELVPGIFTSDDGRPFIDALAARASAAGYTVTSFLTTSAVHGGPQIRKRYHFVASKVKLDFEGVYAVQPPSLLGWRTIRETLAGLTGDEPNSRHITHGALDLVLPFVPPGTYVNQVPDEVLANVYRPRGRQWDATMTKPGVSRIRAMWDGPSPTIVGGASVVHPEQDRFLTVRENARLMGFPDSWTFSDATHGYAEVGKGLTVHTARFLCSVIMAGLIDDVPAEPAPHAIIDFRDRSTAPSLTSSVEFKNQWFQSRHGRPWTGGSSASVPGATRVRRSAVTPVVRIASDSQSVQAKCTEFGLTWVPLAQAETSDVAVVETDAAGMMMAVFSMGACKAARRVLCCPVDGLTLPGIEIVGSIEAAIDLVAAQAAPLLRAKVARMVANIDDSLLAELIDQIQALRTPVTNEPDEQEVADDE